MLGAWRTAGFVHGDIKPANVGFSADGLLHLLDVEGITCLPADDTVALVNVDTFRCTAGYAAPEVCGTDEPEVNASTDLYSAGKMLSDVMEVPHAFALCLRLRDSPRCFKSMGVPWHDSLRSSGLRSVFTLRVVAACRLLQASPGTWTELAAGVRDLMSDSFATRIAASDLILSVCEGNGSAAGTPPKGLRAAVNLSSCC